jgi:kelch-like protein 2/3
MIFDYFYRLNKIVMEEFSSHSLSILIDYMYTGIIEITEDNVQSLLDASNRLQLINVKDSCCEFLAAQLDITNCIGIRRLADMLSCTSLTKQADLYIEQFFW